MTDDWEDRGDVFPGQASGQSVGTVGWIGEHPDDGADVAHLLLYPLRDGAADGMRRIARMLGLMLAISPADPPLVGVDTARLAVADDGGPVARVWGPAGMAAERPVTDEWVEVVTARGWAVVSVGMDGYDGAPQRLTRYISRSDRLHIGRLRLLTEGAAETLDV